MAEDHETQHSHSQSIFKAATLDTTNEGRQLQLLRQSESGTVQTNSVSAAVTIISADQQEDVPALANAFLIFEIPVYGGQGTGNVISGMLAAHLLGEEFNRTVCHVGYESSFDKAFQWKDPLHQKACEEVLQESSNSSSEQKNIIVQNNYDETGFQSECNMKEKLSNIEDFRIIYLMGNTYPRWPAVGSSDPDQRPRDLFHERFTPTQALLDVLPWPTGIYNPPPVVVHLREPDGTTADSVRPGLDETTLDLLASDVFRSKVTQQLRLSCGYVENDDHDGSTARNPPIFLVTNRVDFYDRFSNWSHPDWAVVRHSVSKGLQWSPETGKVQVDNKKQRTSDEQHLLQMWSDWYTILCAKLVYHTLSDFSKSAARWNQGIQSWIILNAQIDAATLPTGAPKTSTSTPLLILERDFHEQETAAIPPLSKREMPSNSSKLGTDRALKHCNQSKRKDRSTEYQQMKRDQLKGMILARRKRLGKEGAAYLEQAENAFIQQQLNILGQEENIEAKKPEHKVNEQGQKAKRPHPHFHEDHAQAQA